MAQTINFNNTTPAPPAAGANVTWQSDSSNPPNISAYQGPPFVVAKSLLTAQSAAIAATTVYSIPSGAAGFYRINFVATITTAASGGANGPSSALGGPQGFQAKYTNALGDTVVKTSNPNLPENTTANTTGSSISGSLIVYAGASTNLQYLFGYSSVGTTAMLFDLAINVEYLGA